MAKESRKKTAHTRNAGKPSKPSTNKAGAVSTEPAPISERTFIMVKPDGVQRGLVGKVLQPFEQRGMKISALKLIQVSPEQARKHYAEHEGKPFYERLLRYIQSGPVVVAVIEAPDAVSQVRKMVGDTDPAKAPVGTIRQSFAQHISFNIIHASDSSASAEREIGIYFSPEEILSYPLDLSAWVLPS